MQLTQVITVIPTFFTQTGAIDFESIHKHINSQINNGIRDFVILGTTSEAPTLSVDERVQVASFVFNNFRNTATIIVGLGGNNTMEMINELERIQNYSHGIMISQPSYNKPSQEGIYQHFNLLISHTDKPVIIYNIPSRCGVNIEPSTIKRIHYDNINQVVAIKEASGNLEQVTQIIELCPQLIVYSGDDALSLPIMSVGGTGVISVVSNLIPFNVVKMLDEFKNGNLSASRDMFYKMKSLVKNCFVETNPVPVKFMLSVMNSQPSLANVRLPLVQLSDESKSKIMSGFSHMVNSSSST